MVVITCDGFKKRCGILGTLTECGGPKPKPNNTASASGRRDSKTNSTLEQ